MCVALLSWTTTGEREGGGGGTHHISLGDSMADVDLAPVGCNSSDQQAERRLAPTQHCFTAVRHMQVWQLRHAPLSRQAKATVSS